MADRIEAFRILDLFSGAGGFSYGMEKNPHFKTVIAVDLDQDAMKTFHHNMPDAQIINGDIKSAEVKEQIIKSSKELHVNMIIGGPPCQGFSLKGKKLGLNDPRNFLFNEYLNIVETLRPEVFTIENVKALLSTSAGWFKNQIIEKVHKLGYHVNYGILNASAFGVPQARERAIFLCCKEKEIRLPVGIDKIVTVRDVIGDLAYLNAGEGEFEQAYITEPSSDYQRARRQNSTKLYNHKASNHSPLAIQKLSLRSLIKA